MPIPPKELKLGKQLALKAIEEYGVDSQLRLMQEECAELIQAISHYFRGAEKCREDLMEELADVSIVREQLIRALIECYMDDGLNLDDYNLAFEHKKHLLEQRLDMNEDRYPEGEPQWL